MQLTAAALQGLVSRAHERHGVAPRSADDLGREAAELGRAAHRALEESETAPKPAKKVR